MQYMDLLSFALRHAHVLLNEQKWRSCNSQHQILCDELEIALSVKEVHRQPPGDATQLDANLHLQGIQMLLTQRQRLATAGLLQPHDFQEYSVMPGDADKDRLFNMLLANHHALSEARVKIQTDTLEQIRTETIIRSTCKAAWHGALSCNKWRPDAQTLVPTFTITWDAHYGRNLPPLRAVWNVPTACTIIPRTTLVTAQKQLQQDAERNAPMQTIFVNMEPGFAEHVKVTLPGFHFRIDICNRNETKASRCRFHWTYFPVYVRSIE